MAALSVSGFFKDFSSDRIPRDIIFTSKNSRFDFSGLGAPGEGRRSI